MVITVRAHCYPLDTVVIITICANQKQAYCLDLEYSVTNLVTSLKVLGSCGYMSTRIPSLNPPPKKLLTNDMKEPI